MRNPVLRKLTSTILVLVSLLLWAGVASDLFMCHESDGYTHLEYKFEDQCQVESDIPASHKVDNGLVLEKGDKSACRDVVLAQDLTNNRKDKRNFYPLAVIAPFDNTRHQILKAQQIPVRPLHILQTPRQALEALRTIVQIV